MEHQDSTNKIMVTTTVVPPVPAVTTVHISMPLKQAVVLRDICGLNITIPDCLRRMTLSSPETCCLAEKVLLDLAWRLDEVLHK